MSGFIPRLLLAQRDPFIFYKFCGLIGFKDKDDTYFSITKSQENKCLLYDKGWKEIDDDEIDNYHTDMGEGHATLLFYELSESESRDDLLQQIELIRTTNYNLTIIESMNSISCDFFMDDLPWESRHKCALKKI